MIVSKLASRRNLVIFGLGVLAILLLIAAPLVLFPDRAFQGSDSVGTGAIQQIAPAYDSSWTANWWTPSPETESMLFALQAAVGGLLIGYVFGFLRGRRATAPRPPESVTASKNR